MPLDPKDVDALLREKYANQTNAPGFADDVERLKTGEPLAYVIGTIPFMGLSIHLDSQPLIPRPETEWWTEMLITALQQKEAIRVLDLCAGSGAIGLALLKELPSAYVAFGEITASHAETIRKNIELNEVDASRTDIRIGDLFAPFAGERYDVIATNPPYIPSDRTLTRSVIDYEPQEALYAGEDGLQIIRRILAEAPHHLNQSGELWMECDISNIEEAREEAFLCGAKQAEIRNDQYGRPRILVAYY